jgi:hypothetical protein
LRRGITGGFLLVSYGPDKKPFTADDITVEVLWFGYISWKMPTGSQMRYIEGVWPPEYHGRFPSPISKKPPSIQDTRSRGSY